MNPTAWTVCVIEPNKFERQIILDLLRSAGAVNVVAFADGEAAVQALAEFKANIIIASFELTPEDGAAWTRAFRRNAALANRQAAVFITSGAFSRPMAEQCRHAGANALIGKPLSAKVLLATIKKVLAQPRPFVDAAGYIGPCRRAGIVTAGAPKKRRSADATAADAAEGPTLESAVATLVVAASAYALDVGKYETCEAALRAVQAYAVNAGDGPLMQACAAFAIHVKAARSIRHDASRQALDTCARAVQQLVALPAVDADKREALALSVNETVANAAQRAA
jgi:CheY-like chemotaxis protein